MFDQSYFPSLHQLLAKATKIDYLLFSLFVLGCLFVVFGMSLVLLNKNQQLLVSASSTDKIISSADSTHQVIVEVAGAVHQPGIFAMPNGSRIGQALERAGGVTTQADQLFLAQQLHLAETIQDGSKIYVPLIEGSKNQAEITPQSSDASSSNALKVSINQADKKTLTSLSGIGDKRAEDIMAARPYQSLEDLIELEILSENLFDEIKNELIL